MSRPALVLSAVAGLFVGGQVAFGYGPGQVVSYCEEVLNGGIIVESAPAGGLVITDIVFGELGSGDFSGIRVNGEVAFSARLGSVRASQSYHFNSGIAVPEGASITARHGYSEARYYTLTGYIPQSIPKGNVPAVSAWGLGVMVLLLLTAASLLMRRRQAA